MFLSELGIPTNIEPRKRAHHQDGTIQFEKTSFLDTLQHRSRFLLGKENAWPLSLFLRSSLLTFSSGKGMYTLFTWFSVSQLTESPDEK